MKSAGLRLAVVAAVVYAAFAGFIFATTVDEALLPGASRITVTGATVTTGAMGLPAIVEETARETRATILRETVDLHDPSVRHLFLAPGGQARAQDQWLVDGYPSFSRSVTTEFHPVSELVGVDPRGRYHVFGEAGSVEKVAEVFSDLGYAVKITEAAFGPAEVFSMFAVGPLGTSTLVAVLLAALLVGSGITSRTKAYAILRLHGTSRRSAALRDIQANAPSALVSMISVAAVMAVFLWLYNRGSQAFLYTQAAATILCAFLLLEAIVYSAVLYLVWGAKLPDGIKGKLGFRVALPMTYLIRVPGLLLAFSVLASTFAVGSAASEAAQAREELDVAGNAATIRFEGQMPPDEMDRLAFEAGAWLRREDSAGRTILVAPVSSAGDDADPDVLIVNNAYLRHNLVLDDDGLPVRSAPSGTALVLAPSGRSLSDAEETVRGMWAADPGQTHNYEARAIAPDQSHYLYQPEPDELQAPTSLHDVILVVVNPDTRMIRDDDYMAYASIGRVLVTDSEGAVRRTPDELMGTFIAAYVPLATRAAEFHAQQVTMLRIQLGTLAVALGVLLTTAVGLAQIYVRGNAQTILVKYLHGWTFTKTHRWLLVAESVLVAAVLAVAAGNLAQVISGRNNGVSDQALVRGADLTAAVAQPLAAVLIAVLNLGLLVVFTHIRTRSMIRTGSEEVASSRTQQRRSTEESCSNPFRSKLLPAR